MSIDVISWSARSEVQKLDMIPDLRHATTSAPQLGQQGPIPGLGFVQDAYVGVRKQKRYNSGIHNEAARTWRGAMAMPAQQVFDLRLTNYMRQRIGGRTRPDRNLTR